MPCRRQSSLVSGLARTPSHPCPSAKSPLAAALPGLPWPMEQVEELAAIMKQHQSILDIQLCGCSLLLRILGPGGRPPLPVSCVGSREPAPPALALHRWLHDQAGPPPVGPSPPRATSPHGALLHGSSTRPTPASCTESEGLPAPGPQGWGLTLGFSRWLSSAGTGPS